MFSHKSNLYDSKWLAVVFANRNQNYGAYELRIHSAQRLFKAFLIVVPAFVLLFIVPMIYSKYRKAPDVEVNVVMQTQAIEPILELKKEAPKKEEPKKELPKEKLMPVAKTVNLSANIKVVEETIVEPPTTAEVSIAVIGSVTTNGTESNANAMPSANTQGGAIDGNGTGTDNTLYTTGSVEVYPEFPGGMEGWAKFLRNNLRYPYMAQESEIQGKVYISFVVEKDGSITDVKVVKGIGGGCDEEAVRVIKKSPKWKAGLQNDQAVRVRYQMPIHYALQ
jgi:protein TonB